VSEEVTNYGSNYHNEIRPQIYLFILISLNLRTKK